MNRLECSTIYLARLVLEAETALSISTGNPDGVFDTALVRDANGLPAIPGTSLAGVLRHLWDETGDADALFGYQNRKEGGASRLVVSWGLLLDSQGRSAEGLLTGDREERLEDPLYGAVIAQIDAPVYRDRVHVTHHGAASSRGKFDRSVLPAGHRFAVELRLWAESPETAGSEWDRLLSLLRHPAFRLGGNTRAGLGRMKLVSAHEACFDLRDCKQRRHFCALGRGIDDTDGLAERQVEIPVVKGWKPGTLRLKARGPWRIGQGSKGIARRDKPADLLPRMEERIDWMDGKGERKLGMLLIPASSIKGALAHRMTFHARRFAGEWNTGSLDDERSKAARQLLGWIKDSRDGNEKGQVGRLILDDVSLTLEQTQVVHLMHNAIDRFTGGVRDRVLFDEESLLGGEFEVHLAVNARDLDDDAIRRAFKAALDDLCQGRLAIGSRTTTGNGFFNGQLTGPLADWLDETQRGEVA